MVFLWFFPSILGIPWFLKHHKCPINSPSHELPWVPRPGSCRDQSGLAMAFQRATHRFPRNLWLLKWGIPGIFTMFFLDFMGFCPHVQRVFKFEVSTWNWNSMLDWSGFNHSFLGENFGDPIRQISRLLAKPNAMKLLFGDGLYIAPMAMTQTWSGHEFRGDASNHPVVFTPGCGTWFWKPVHLEKMGLPP